MVCEKTNEVMGLREYIKEYFGGCQVNFAKSCGKSPQHIWRQLSSCEYIVVNGQVAQIKYSASPLNNEKPK